MCLNGVIIVILRIHICNQFYKIKRSHDQLRTYYWIYSIIIDTHIIINIPLGLLLLIHILNIMSIIIFRKRLTGDGGKMIILQFDTNHHTLDMLLKVHEQIRGQRQFLDDLNFDLPIWFTLPL